MPPGLNEYANASQVAIVVNGAALQPVDLGQLVDVTVEQDTALPEAFAIRLRDQRDLGSQGAEGGAEGYFGLLNSDRFRIGHQVEIKLGRGGTGLRTILKGEITSLEMDARPEGDMFLTVRGYDRAHRLHRQRKTRTFVQMKDADVVTRIAREYGLTAEATSAGPLHEHLFQDNQTDWEFLRARASDLGCELYVRDSKLVFRQPDGGGTPPQHVLFTSLLKLRLRMSTPAQVSEVSVRGWDPQTKQVIVGTAGRTSDYLAPDIGERRNGATIAQTFGDGHYTVTAHNVGTQDEAQQLAQAIYDEIAGEFIQLEGTCTGDPNVCAGQPISLGNLGERYTGTYYVTAVTHRLTPADGYLTNFTVSGRQPLTLSALLGAGQGNGATAGNHRSVLGLGGSAGRYGGVVVGVVTNNRPAANMEARHGGQVKVKFPWLSDEQDSQWARIASPMAGADRGFYFLPEVNDEVLVAFEHGDINRPYVVGSLWNGKDRPPRSVPEVVASDGRVQQRIIKSRTGHTIILDDSDDKPGITIVDQTERNRISLDSKHNRMVIAVEGDLDIVAKGAVTLKGKSLNLEATNGEAALKGRDAILEARGGTVTAKGTNANLEATGGRASVRGAGETEITANARLNLKGALVNIN